MRPGVTAAQVAAEGTARARAARDPGTAALALFGSAEPPTITAMPALEVAIADVRPAIRVMVAAVVLLFATAIASVVVVQLARVARRRREMALRAALGASTARLARQWLTESVAIGVAGGILGIAWRASARRTAAGNPARRLPSTERDHARLACRAGVGSGDSRRHRGLCALPRHARPPSRHHPGACGRCSRPIGAGMRTPAARLRSAIMAGQVAVACVLLIGGGLLGRSFQALTNIDRGYDPANLLTARLPLPSGPTFATSAAMFESIKERMRALPGVTHAAFGNALPLVSAGGMTGLNVRLPRDPATESKIQALHRTVDPDYFGAMGLRLVAGRLLSDSDSQTAQPVLVVNKSFADQYLGADPLGRRLTLDLYRRAEWEIVGVVEDMKQGGLQTGRFVATTDAAQPEMFSSYRQFGEMRLDTVFFLARAQSDPSGLVPSVRALVREQAPALVLDSVMTMEERVMASLSRPRAYALVVGAMAAFALAIACVGLFGVLSYSVAQRAREIGVRTALGATTTDVVTLVLRSGLAIVAAGLAGGLAAAGLLVQSLSKILFGVGPFDPVTFAIVPLFLVLAATVACVAPARRAARIDPLRALRGD